MLLNDFVNAGVSCGVLSEADVSQHLPAINGSQDAARLAGVLVGAGKLTQYQAEMLLRGGGQGLVLGNYTLLDRLGQGGMGDVFKARHRRMDRIVAVKTISPHFLRVPDALDRFYREAKAAARLTHPNIVTAHDADEAGGVHFLVMEYVIGSDLDAIVTLHGPLTPAQAMHITLEAARGLEYAHSKGVVHRDIKPANVMFTLEGTVKILDMGLARIDQTEGERFTRTNCGFGSIDYMPPEQADSARLADQRSDIYSLGCTLFKLATGKVMYENTSVLKSMAAHRDAPIPSLSVSHPKGDRLAALYRRMVAKLPDDRPATMSDVIAELAPLVGTPDLGPLMIAVRAMHDRPSWLIDPEAKTIRPGEAATPAPSGGAAPPPMPATRKETVKGAPQTAVADRSPSSLAWKTMPAVPGEDALSLAPIDSSSGTTLNPRQAEATVPLTAGSAVTPIKLEPIAARPAVGGDWLDDVVSQSRSVDPLKKRLDTIDPKLLMYGGAGLGGMVLLVFFMWLISGPSQPLDSTKLPEFAQGAAKKIATFTQTPTNTNPGTTNPVAIPRPVPPPVTFPEKSNDPTKSVVDPPEFPPKKFETPIPPDLTPEKPPEKAPDKTPPEKNPPPEIEVVDLLKAIDVKHDGIGKLWERQPSGLVARPREAAGTHTAGEAVLGLQLPVTVTSTYRLRMVVEHLALPGPLVIAFPEGREWRLVVIDEPPRPEPPPPKLPPPPPPKKGGGPPRDPPKGGPPAGQPPPVREPADIVLKSGKQTLVFRVRDNGKTIECDGERMTAAGPNLPPLREMTDLSTKKTVMLLSLGNYRISALEWEANPQDD